MRLRKKCGEGQKYASVPLDIILKVRYIIKLVVLLYNENLIMEVLLTCQL